jgi:hypothetical protein
MKQIASSLGANFPITGCMKKRLGPKLLGMAVFFVTLASFQNCGSYSQNTFGKFNEPSTLAPSDLYLAPKPVSMSVEPLEDKIVIGGDCEVGSYPNHFIEYQLLSAEGNPYVAAGTLIRISPDVNCVGNNCFKYSLSKCEQGKFYAHIPLPNTLPGDQQGVPYTLKVTLVLIDSSGAEKRDLYSVQNVQVLVYGN